MRLLPKFHLYTIAAIALIVIIVLFLWPSAPKLPVTSPPQTIGLTPPVQDDPLGDLMAQRQLTDTPNTTENTLPQDDNLPPVAQTQDPAPQPTAEQPPVTTETAPVATTAQDAPLVSQRFTVKKGQTIAQVFRNNGLPVDDLFRMTAVEGAQKPLNQVGAGDKIRVIRGKDKTITELRIDKTSGQSVTFKRQKDGSYRRS
ncbi:LysM-like peptidoglycan-binding domain-containing protein [Morganella psychrotolerans]|uniref:LysM-like peptidoglycan-binding domain-containing protein n=1 Tax=Morganella psychrotolerans TaxID=368603 RepID=UPI0039B0BF8B